MSSGTPYKKGTKVTDVEGKSAVMKDSNKKGPAPSQEPEFLVLDAELVTKPAAGARPGPPDKRAAPPGKPEEVRTEEKSRQLVRTGGKNLTEGGGDAPQTGATGGRMGERMVAQGLITTDQLNV